MPTKIALIAGATGAIGSALAKELCSDYDWTVYGLSRNKPTQAINGVRYLQVDLSDKDQCHQQLMELSDVTHVYYCGRATHAEQVLESAEDNLLLLRNLVTAIEAVANIQHVHLVQGGKYYGVHIGPFPTPAVEEQPRAPVPNFNYEQQDYLASQAKNWTWTSSRPNTLVHYSPHNARNLVSSLGVYASLCKALGSSLDFPGPEGAYHSVTQVTSIDVLARGIKWMSTTESCANQGFNITNTDVFRWSTIWPLLASAFDMTPGSVRPMKLADLMSNRQQTTDMGRHLPQQFIATNGFRSGSELGLS